MSESENKSDKPKKKLFWRVLKIGLILGVVGALAVTGTVIWAIVHYGRNLPDYRALADYSPAVVTRIHAGDGSLLREFSTEPRLFVPIETVPDKLIKAFLAAEDKNFYEHNGLDYIGLVRAVIKSVINVARGRRPEGASTITQQMARNFLLTLDQKLDRKIKEMILTLRIERAFTKDQILELYLNEINFGNRSFGIAAAALNYFNKSLAELTVAEMAYLAALPKGPHNYHPIRNKQRAMARRNWVLSRMAALEFISAEEYTEARASDLITRTRSNEARFKADYFAEEVRRELADRYGSKQLYQGGLSVRTSLEPRLQAIAERELKRGLVAYDRRHGWRGPLGRLDVTRGWADALGERDISLGMPGWRKALVHEVQAEGAIVGFQDGTYGWMPKSTVMWARRTRENQRLGPKIKDIAEVVTMGDIIAVQQIETLKPISLPDFVDDDGIEVGEVLQFGLRQIPEISGGLVAMDPHTGRVLALVGGFDFDVSEYNRAVQAKRQPGSAFKPFVYAAALEEGFTPTSLVLDAPFVIEQGAGMGKWKPKNSSNKFYGPSTLRLGIEKSRNLMTVRLAQHLGMDKVIDIAKRFGLHENMQSNLASSLGASEVTLMQLTAAYGMLVNGGKSVSPTLIDRIQDRRGRTIFRHDPRRCPSCGLPLAGRDVEPQPEDGRTQVLDPRIAYQSVSMMEGVVERGTGRKIRVLNRPLAGKTGTTNDSTDAWFVGFSPDLVVGIYAGFDNPRSLGRGEEGSSVAVPIFRDFMREALANTPAVPFRIPPGVRLVRVNAQTGELAGAFDKNVIYEAFVAGSEPNSGKLAVLDGSSANGDKAPKQLLTEIY